MGLTPAQHADRRHFLGGTDMAALARMSRWATPMSVWLDKTGAREEDRTPTRMMALGTVLEPVVASLFQQVSGMHLRRQSRAVRDRQRPWLGGHIDRWAHRPPDGWVPGIFEAKWAMGDDGWGETASADIPPDYAVQVQHYLGVTGRPVAYVGALLGYADFRWYALPRDEDAIGTLRELGSRFWHDNVVAGVPPDPDGSDGYSDWLQQRYAAQGKREAVATPEQVLWADHLASLDRRIAHLQVERAKRAQVLQDSMASVTHLLLPSGTLRWGPQYERTDTRWKAVAEALAAEAALVMGDTPATLLLPHVRRHSTTTTQRPFVPPKSKEDTTDATA